MIFNQYFKKIYTDINRTAKSLNNTAAITKLFLLFLILLFMCCLFNSFDASMVESFDNNKKYEKKLDGDAYDNFYSKHYDPIHLNTARHEFEFDKITSLSKKDKITKILDVGCGTGYMVNVFNDNKYDIIGLDKSEDMISYAEKTYPKCEFITNDITENNILELNSYTHVLCLGKTIYEIKDKEAFFENCFSLLSNDGFLIINLVDREKFNPYVQNKNSDTLYDPEKYGKKVSELIVKFDKDNEYISKYKVLNTENDNTTDTDATPYAMYNEKFSNYKLHTVRENEINLYMPITTKILNLAKSKDFKLYKKLDLKEIGHSNEYMYVFKKLE
jgi:2-polyprenyl-3-methyl-5-hydroxy-6-metoxy-1,4-benzoquinol methylase